jgi:hypothetical protein
MPIDLKNAFVKFRPFVFDDLPPKTFGALFTGLSTQLDMVRIEAPKGKPIPPAAKAEPGTTDTGAKAYGDARKKANDDVKKMVDSLSTAQVMSLIGLGFTSPGDDKKNRTDIVNTVMSAWDKVASKYMKNALTEGDSLRANLRNRLQELDVAISTNGATAVKPDEA